MNSTTATMLNSTEATNRSSMMLPQNYLQLVNSKMATIMIIPITYVAFMMVLGLIGNSLVVYVYGFKWNRSPVKCFITTLAAFDLINCLVTMPTEIATLVNFFLFDAHVFCKLSRFSTFWMNNASVVLLFAIAIDRFIKICLPNKKSFDYNRAKMTCFISAFIGLLVSWPSLIIYGNKTFPMPPNGPFTAIQCSVADGVGQTSFRIGFTIYLWVAFLAIAFVMIVLYALIGAKIWMLKSRGDKRKSSLKSSLKRSGSHSDDKGVALTSVKKLAKDEQTNSVELSDDAFDADSSSTPSDEKKKNKVYVKQTSVKSTSDQRERTASTSTKSRLKLMSRSISISKSGLQAGKATMMLFVITMVYILSFLPYLVISIMFNNYGPRWYPSLSTNSQIAVNLFVRSYLISNTANAVVYGFGNAKFREECRKLMKRLVCCNKTTTV